MNYNIIDTKTGNIELTAKPNTSEAYVMEFSQGADTAINTVNLTAKDNSTVRLHLLYNSLGSADSIINVNLGNNCDVMVSVAMINGKNVNVNLNVEINGEHSTFRAPGIIMPGEGQSFRYNSVIDHKAGKSATYQKVRTVANGNGQADFFGIVKVERDAQKSETEQVNNNILLTETARIESKPQLEIYADDVKCSHGSTTGMLDKDQIFYMRSRGISEKTAQGLMLQAFLGEVISDIDSADYADRLTEAINHKL